MSQGQRELERCLDELYAAAPSIFLQKRDELARELKAAGDIESAADLGRRRKPTQIAWVLNMLARRHPDSVVALVDVGRALAREHRKVSRGDGDGKKSSALGEVMARQRTVVADVTQRTAVLMKELGVGPKGQLDEVATALRAALTDPRVGEQLEEGHLEKAPGPITNMLYDEEPLLVSTPARASKAPRATESKPKAEERPKATAKPATATAKPAKAIAKPAKLDPKAAVKARAGAEKAAARAAAEAKSAAAKASAEAEKAAAKERVKAKKVAAKERTDRERAAADKRRAVAAATARLRAAEQEARRTALAAERAQAVADKARAHARHLAEAAQGSARAVDEARALLEGSA